MHTHPWICAPQDHALQTTTPQRLPTTLPRPERTSVNCAFLFRLPAPLLFPVSVALQALLAFLAFTASLLLSLLSCAFPCFHLLSLLPLPSYFSIFFFFCFFLFSSSFSSFVLLSPAFPAFLAFLSFLFLILFSFFNFFLPFPRFSCSPLLLLLCVGPRCGQWVRSFLAILCTRGDSNPTGSPVL